VDAMSWTKHTSSAGESSMPSAGTQHDAGVVRVAKNVKKKATEAMFPTNCQLALLLQLHHMRKYNRNKD